MMGTQPPGDVAPRDKSPGTSCRVWEEAGPRSSTLWGTEPPSLFLSLVPAPSQLAQLVRGRHRLPLPRRFGVLFLQELSPGALPAGPGGGEEAAPCSIPSCPLCTGHKDPKGQWGEDALGLPTQLPQNRSAA